MFFAKAKGKRADIYIYESIGEGWFGGITAKSFADTLKEIGKVDALDIYINSPGGSVFDGIAIHNQIKRFAGEKIVHIDGIAASIASVVAMAGDEIRIADNGMMMIHQPWGMAIGTADDMRKYAESLDKVHDTILDTYVSKTSAKRDQVDAWMTDETWMNADECVERGFATSKTESKSVQAAFAMLNKFKNVPDAVKRRASAPVLQLARMNMRASNLSRGASPARA
jgi:ATP-dependent Clp protease, protease subunit